MDSIYGGLKTPIHFKQHTKVLMYYSIGFKPECKRDNSNEFFYEK